MSNTSAFEMPSPNADRSEFLQAYSQCTDSDPRFVVDAVVDNYKIAVQWLNDNPPPKAGAITLTGRPTSLGWSFQIYKGIYTLQRCFNTPWVFYDGIGLDEAEDAFDRMVAEGATFIFAGALEYVPEIVPRVAAKYPSVVIMIPFFDPVIAGIPNVRAINSRFNDGGYLMGYLSQLMSPMENLGHIPGPVFFVEYQVVNFYYAGMWDAAKASNTTVKKLHTKWSTNYDDFDLNMGAANSLLSEVDGLDESIISTSSSVFDVHRQLQQQGIMSTTGSADLGPFVGNLLLGGIVSRWEISLAHAYSYFLQGNATGWGPNTPPLLPSNMWLGSLFPGTLSPIIPSDILESINQVRLTMQQSPEASLFMLCHERVKYWLPNESDLDESGCLTLGQLLSMNKLDPNIDNLGVYVIPIEEITVGEGLKAVMSVLVGLVTVFDLVALLMIALYPQSYIIRMTSHVMSAVMLFFALISLIGLMLLIPDPTDELCKASLGLFMFGIFGALSTLLCKTYGFHLVNRNINKMANNPIKLQDILWVFVSYIPPLALIIAYLAVSPGSTTYTMDDTRELDKYETMEVCDFNDASEGLAWALVGYAMMMYSLVFYICFNLSKTSVSIWKAEQRHAYMASAISFICIGVGMVAVLAIEDNRDSLLLVTFICGVGIVAALIITFFGPKVWILLFDRSNPKIGNWQDYRKQLTEGSVSRSTGHTSVSRSTGHTNSASSDTV